MAEKTDALRFHLVGAGKVHHFSQPIRPVNQKEIAAKLQRPLGSRKYIGKAAVFFLPGGVEGAAGGAAAEIGGIGDDAMEAACADQAGGIL